MGVLILFERSGALRNRFLDAGIDAWSLDAAPAEDDAEHPRHIVSDFDSWAARTTGQWDLVIAHPPCQYLAGSGLHWNRRVPGREQKTQEAMAFALKVHWLVMGMTKRLVFENPVGAMTRLFGRPQYVQPYMFGDDASKKTGLWRWGGLPPLVPLPEDQWAKPRIVDGKPRWANQTDSGQNRLAPSAHRAIDRARTYPGIADAIVAQWGAYVTGA